MRLIHDLGRSITLRDEARDLDLWSYVYRGKAKPFFHPLRTPAGISLTNFEPHDHLWHRGLWFTIKYINKENFWEENEAHGTQQTMAPPHVSAEDDGRVAMYSRQRWVRPGGAGEVFDEKRQVTYVPLERDAYALDFFTVLTPLADLELDRTLFTTWGGYGGLILRGTRNWQETRIMLSDGSVTDRPVGQRGLWADLSGKLDGGLNLTGGVAFFDHPSNARHPSPWYGSGEQKGNYLNAAFLFHEPMRLEKGESLPFRYRVLVHDGLWAKDRLDAAWTTYVKASGG